MPKAKGRCCTCNQFTISAFSFFSVFADVRIIWSFSWTWSGQRWTSASRGATSCAATSRWSRSSTTRPDAPSSSSSTPTHTRATTPATAACSSSSTKVRACGKKTPKAWSESVANLTRTIGIFRLFLLCFCCYFVPGCGVFLIWVLLSSRQCPKIGNSKKKKFSFFLSKTCIVDECGHFCSHLLSD